MPRKFRQVTITLNEEVLKKFKSFCKLNALPLSRFLSYAGIKFIKIDEQEVTKNELK